MRGTPAILAVTALGAVLVAAPAASAATPVSALGARLTGRSQPAATRAAEEALARGGIAIRRGRRTLRRAARPAARMTATPFEAFNLALDARRGGRATLAQLATTWRRLRVIRRRGDPGALLRKALSSWVKQARRHPRDPQSFAALLVADLAKRRAGADLASGRYDPRRVTVGLLEVQLLSAAFTRLPRGALVVRSAGRRAPARRRARSATTIDGCSDILDAYLDRAFSGLGDAGKAIGKTVVKEGVIKQLTKKVGPYGAAIASTFGLGGREATATLAKVYGQIFAALYPMLRLQKLIALYNSTSFYIDPASTTVEKPEDRVNQLSTLLVGYQARAGLSEDVERQYNEKLRQDSDVYRNRKAIRDCAKLFGLPDIFFPEDTAGELDKFRVKWTLNASPDDAFYDFKKTKYFAPGGRIGKLTRVDPVLAVHDFHTQIRTQQPWSYAPDLFEQRRHEGSVTAELQTDQPLDPKLLIGVVLGGGTPKSLIKPLSDALIGWFEALTPKKDTADLDITFHVPKCGGVRAAGASPRGTNVCRDVRGTFSGSLRCGPGGGCAPYPAGFRLDWTGSFTLVRAPDLVPGFSGPPAYDLRSGSVNVSASGTLPDGCTLSGSKGFDLIAENTIPGAILPPGGSGSPLPGVFLIQPGAGGAPSTYRLTMVAQLARLPIAITCPPPKSSSTGYFPLAGVSLIQTPTPPALPATPGRLTGSYTGTPLGAGDYLYDLRWELSGY